MNFNPRVDGLQTCWCQLKLQFLIMIINIILHHKFDKKYKKNAWYKIFWGSSNLCSCCRVYFKIPLWLPSHFVRLHKISMQIKFRSIQQTPQWNVNFESIPFVLLGMVCISRNSFFYHKQSLIINIELFLRYEIYLDVNKNTESIYYHTAYSEHLSGGWWHVMIVI